MKGHRAHIVVGLLVEGSALSLVMMFWLWGIVALGSQTVVRETHSPMAQSAPKYVAVCHAPDTSKKGAALGAAGEGGLSSEGLAAHTHLALAGGRAC